MVSFEKNTSCFRGTSVIIVTRLRAGRPGFSSRQGQWRDSFSPPPQTDRIWGPQTSYPMGTGGSSPEESGRGVKLPTHLHFSAEFENAWSYTSTPPVGLHGVVLS